MTTERDHDPQDEAIEKMVADALVRRGDLLPTTVGEVERAEASGIEYEGELPASLKGFDAAEAAPPKSKHADAVGPAMSERVVSLEAARRERARRGGSALSYVGTFAAGLAVAAGAALLLRTPATNPLGPEPAGGPMPATSTSAEPAPQTTSIPAIATCGAGSCCAGASCDAAKGELKKCASGRPCVTCDAPPNSAAFEVVVANVVPAEKYAGPPMESLDLCGRVLGGEWSCAPAFSQPSEKAGPRKVGPLVTASDLASGLEFELRPRGTKLVIGHWRDSVRLGPNVLCRGLGALLTTDKKEDVGSLAIGFGDPYYVEIARAADVNALKSRRAMLAFADVTPFIIETTASGDRHFALAAGPFDQGAAEKLRWLLVERSAPASTVFGSDFQGGPLALP